MSKPTNIFRINFSILRIKLLTIKILKAKHMSKLKNYEIGHGHRIIDKILNIGSECGAQPWVAVELTFS
jgi:hypothetical protein